MWTRDDVNADQFADSASGSGSGIGKLTLEAPGADGTTTVAAGQQPDGIPHLTSPDNPPPGTSTEPVGPQSGPNVSYLKELWHAVQTQEISKNDALMALAQQGVASQVQLWPQGELPPALVAL